MNRSILGVGIYSYYSKLYHISKSRQDLYRIYSTTKRSPILTSGVELEQRETTEEILPSIGIVMFVSRALQYL